MPASPSSISAAGTDPVSSRCAASGPGASEAALSAVPASLGAVSLVAPGTVPLSGIPAAWLWDAVYGMEDASGVDASSARPVSATASAAVTEQSAIAIDFVYRYMCIPPTIIKSSRSSFAGSDFSGRRRSVASEPSGKIGAMRLQLISKSFADSDILVSCGQRFTYSSMWFLSTWTRV